MSVLHSVVILLKLLLFNIRVREADWLYEVKRGKDTPSKVRMAQILTGHGGFVQYLFRLKLRDSLYCACDPTKIQDVLHVLKKRYMFLWERVALITEIDIRVARQHFMEIMDDTLRKDKFLKFCAMVVDCCVKLNRNI
ncbi:hypothetical protein EVAR_47925_1 [Eumeta japonica]|uniref:Uncharacterized protein n=1 Tax=Eumeta variegata TaxID=151549 RepID=A0A4C1Y6S7_EUMVA|nr:hypothetical protein EVAR_47925_1 [Eumeta japonica]